MVGGPKQVMLGGKWYQLELTVGQPVEFMKATRVEPVPTKDMAQIKAEAEEKLLAIADANAREDEMDFSGLPIDMDRLQKIGYATVGEGTTLTALNLSNTGMKSGEADVLGRFLEHSTTLKVLNLSGNTIGHKGVTRLARDVIAKDMPLTDLNLAGNQVGLEGGQKIGRALDRNTHLKSLNLAQNRLETGGCGRICVSLRTKNTTLASLDVSYSDADGRTVASMYAEMLSGNTCLENLSLAGIGMGDAGAECLGPTLARNSTLRSLSLRENAIGMWGVGFLAEGLARNTGLRSLDLAANGAQDTGAEGLARALLNNSTLQALDCSANMITDRGSERLMLALQENGSLRTIGIEGNGTGPGCERRWQAWHLERDAQLPALGDK